MTDGQMKTIQCWRIDRLKTVSEANSSENRWVKAKRHKLQKAKVKVAMRAQRPCPLFTEHRDENSTVTHCNLRIIVTRIAPRSLDCQDNLPCSLKYVVDSIAEELTGDYRPGRADGAEWIKWEYRQEKGKPKEYAVRIEMMTDD